MRTYTFRAVIERGDVGEWVVSFPDVPEAITQAGTIQEARAAGQDALGLALLSYPLRGRPLPERRFGQGQLPASDTQAIDADITTAPDVTAKLALLEVFRSSGRSEDELATMLVINGADVHRMLDPMEPTDILTLSLALEALGQRLVVGIEPIGRAA